MALENPTLNDHAFQKAMAENPGAARAGFHVAVVYLMTGLLLVVLIAGAAVGWSQVDVDGAIARMPAWFGLVSFLTLIVGLAAVFSPRTAILTGSLYALGEGLMLGAISHFYEAEYEGIVAQSIAATLGIFLSVYVLYSLRFIKATPALARYVIIASFGLMLLYMITWFLTLFGADFRFLNEPTPAGIALAFGIVLLGTAFLPGDFDFVEKVAKEGAPSWMQFYAAFGLVLALIWIYVAVLRFLALVRAGS